MDYNDEIIRGIVFVKENVHRVYDIDGKVVNARIFLLVPLRKNIDSSKYYLGELYTAVMMNTSEATTNFSDPTVPVIINRTYEKGFSYVLILNTINLKENDFLKLSMKTDDFLFLSKTIVR